MSEERQRELGEGDAPVEGELEESFNWLRWFGPVVLFNLVGGIGLVTVLRLVRTKPLVQQRRRSSPPDPDAPRFAEGR